MTELHAARAARVEGWRASGYAHDRYPAIAEILTLAGAVTGGDRIEVAKAKGRADRIPIQGAYAATILPADARGETTSS